MENDSKFMALLLILFVVSHSYGMDKIKKIRKNTKEFVNNHPLAKATLVMASSSVPFILIPVLLKNYQLSSNNNGVNISKDQNLNNHNGINIMIGSITGVALGALVNKYNDIAIDVGLLTIGCSTFGALAISSILLYLGPTI